MATCARKSLSTLLSRRLLPSSSALHHLHPSPEPPRIPAGNLPPPFFPGGRNPNINPFFSFHRNYSVSTESSDISLITTSDVDAVTAPPLPFSGEVAAAAADSFPTVAALQHVIDAVHSFTGLNWWACIALATVMIRGITVPVLLNQMRASHKLTVLRPEIEKIKYQLNNVMDPQAKIELHKKMKDLFKKHGVTPFSPFKGIFIQWPIFVSFFFAIRNMVTKVPSFKGGGTLWFTDLTTPDSLYIFPVLTGLTFLLSVELNMQEGIQGNPLGSLVKNFSRVLAVLTVPFTASFAKGIFCYWITSNLFSLTYGLVIKRPPVRKFLNLPVIVPESTIAAQPNFSFSNTKPPAASVLSAKESEQGKTPEKKVSTSTVISQRIRNLERTVKARKKTNKK